MSDQKAIPTAERIEKIRQRHAGAWPGYPVTRSDYADIRDALRALDAAQARIAELDGCSRQGGGPVTDLIALSAARTAGFEAGRAAFAADLREQGKVVVDRIALLDAGAMLKAWAPKGSGGWVQQIEETLPEAFDV